MGKSGVFGAYLRWLESGFLQICRYDSKRLAVLVGKQLLLSYGAAAVGMLIVLLISLLSGQQPDFFTICNMCFVAYIAIREIPEIENRRLKKSFHRELISYLAAVRRKFVSLSNVPMAIEAGALNESYEIRKNAEEFKNILLTGNRRRTVEKYLSNPEKDRYMKLFLIQAYAASEYGDTKSDREGSMFSENLELLRTEITRELYHIRKRQYLFTGYMTVSVLPVLFAPVVRRVGIGFADSMREFYEGMGKIVLLSAVLAAFIVYSMVADAKSDKGLQVPDKLGRKLFVFTFLGRLGNRLEEGIEKNASFLLKGIKKLVTDTGTGANTDGILKNMVRIWFMSFVIGFCYAVSMRGKGLGAVIIISLIASFAPILGLVYEKELAKEHQNAEIKSLQTVILMERRLENMTVPGLLKDLELFAVYFKPEIRECLNSYSQGPQNALGKLRLAGLKKSRDFADIAEGFLSVDEVGIEEAFADISVNREGLDRMGELETDIREDNSRNFMDLISRVPGLLIIGGYFIVPFVSVSIKEMEGLFEMLKI